MRLDEYLVEIGCYETRAKAQAAIMAGEVLVDGLPARKAGTAVRGQPNIERLQRNPFVSRGGLKLQKALETFGVGVDGRVCLDSGAATGGFTDCLLQHGARCVYAVDVGYGQLATRLREDPRVVPMERTNIRFLERLPEAVEAVTLDLSFISLRLVLPSVIRLIAPGADLLTLVKPQFEAGREAVGKKGVVRDAAVHRGVLAQVAESAHGLGCAAQAATWSPLRGPEGNIEYWLWLKQGGAPQTLDFEATVAGAWDELIPDATRH